MSYFKTAVCAIGRLENKYAREFVDHYLKLGFTTVIIADNNHDGEEHFEDVLQDYIDNDSVKILDYRNMVGCQMQCYTELYKRFKDEYDWIAFFDFDEFLEIPNHNRIEDFLKDKAEFDCVMVNWLCFGDNGQIEADYTKPMQERFKEPLPIDLKVQYNFSENMHIKSILKGGLDNVVFKGNPHCTDSHLKCCNASGVQVNNRPWQMIDYRQAYLKHYVTKSLEEWYTNKMVRGSGDRNYETFLQFYKDRYFRYNKPTQEKIDWLKAHDIIRAYA